MSADVRVVLGVVLRRRPGGWRVLVARRRRGAVLGGFWELPGGKVEPGETLEEALKRELREEVGLAVTAESALPAIEHEYDHGRVRLHPFVCTAGKDDGGALEPVEEAEAPETRWLGADELPAYRFPPANDCLMRWIADELRRRDREHAGQEVRA